MPVVSVIGDESSVCATADAKDIPHSSARLVLSLLRPGTEYIVQQYKSRYILVRYSTKVACLDPPDLIQYLHEYLRGHCSQENGCQLWLPSLSRQTKHPNDLNCSQATKRGDLLPWFPMPRNTFEYVHPKRPRFCSRYCCVMRLVYLSPRKVVSHHFHTKLILSFHHKNAIASGPGGPRYFEVGI